MRRASAEGKEAGVEEGILIAQEMLRDALPVIQGVQVSAPFGKVPLALRVFDAIPGWQGARAKPIAVPA
jgi:homocysteine S-methyltransferase